MLPLETSENRAAYVINGCEQTMRHINENMMLTEAQKSEYNGAFLHIITQYRKLMHDISLLRDYQTFFTEYQAKANELFHAVVANNLQILDVPQDASDFTKRVIEANNRLVKTTQEMGKFIRQHKSETLHQPFRHIEKNVDEHIREKAKSEEATTKWETMTRLFGRDVSQTYTLKEVVNKATDDDCPF